MQRGATSKAHETNNSRSAKRLPRELVCQRFDPTTHRGPKKKKKIERSPIHSPSLRGFIQCLLHNAVTRAAAHPHSPSLLPETGARGRPGETRSGGDVCFLQSPPMSGDYTEGWSSTCVLGREKFHTFPLTITFPLLAFGVWLILDGKCVSNQPVKTDRLDRVATYNRSALEIMLLYS